MEGPKSIAAGALGTRLAGRLTADLVLRSPQFMSCIGEYQIDFRGNKISAVENLGATQNQFDSIDFSDNNIMILEGFSRLPRLQTLYLNNNRIIRIGKNLHESIPALSTLILTNNRIKNLQDINPLADLPKLKVLSLVGNELVLKPQYRLYVVHRLKALEHLDFKIIKQKERDEAERIFGEGRADAADSAEAAAAAADKTFEPGEGLAEAEGVAAGEAQMAEAAAVTSSKGPSAEQVTAIKAAIQNAQTLQEVAELERALVTGNVPSKFQDGAANGVPEQQGASAMEED